MRIVVRGGTLRSWTGVTGARHTDCDTRPMAEHKTKPIKDHRAEDATGQEGSGRQHPTGTGPAYRAPKERGSAGGNDGGEKHRH